MNIKRLFYIFLCEYLIIFFVISFLLYIVYIKLKYPFWNLQPVFHEYDYLRHLQRKPFIVFKKVFSTKYLLADQMKTFEYMQCDAKKIHKFIDFIQCNYIEQDNILTLSDKKTYHSYFSGQKHPSYFSFYQEVIQTPQYQNTIVLGCITSRCIYLTFENMKIPIYFIDYLCIHRSFKKDNKLISCRLIQSHEYNQRIQNPTIQVSLLKQEGNPYHGVIPLIKYKKLLFYLMDVTTVNALPQFYTCIVIQKNNIDLLTDFINRVTTIFRFTAMGDFANICSLITNNELHVCCLCKGKHILAYYFFRNAQKQYDHIGNTMEFIGSYNNTRSEDLFYLGFLHSLHNISKSMNYKVLVFETISHNNLIIHRFIEFHTLISQHNVYYYLYNYIIPSSPLKENDCFFLM